MLCRTDRSGGTVWTWSEPIKSFYGIKYKFDHWDDGKGTVVILCQDGVWGNDDFTRSRGEQLLDLRWKKLDLMEYIVSSPDFAAGNFKASIEAAFLRMDEQVKEVVDKMDIEWREPVLWKACDNSFVVVLSGNKLYMAGGGGFQVHRINPREGRVNPRDGVVLLSSMNNCAVTDAKVFIVSHYFQGTDSISDERRKFVRPYIEYALTFDDTLFHFYEYVLSGSDECVVIEVCHPGVRTGRRMWLKLRQKDWGSTLAEVAQGEWGISRECFGAVLLELPHFHYATPEASTVWQIKKTRAKRRKTLGPFPAIPVPVPMMIDVCSPSP